MNVLLHTAAVRLHRSYRADNLLAAFAAKCLAGLHSCTASVAKHVSFSLSRIGFNPTVLRNNRNKISPDT
jgi:hypothetical protein